VPNGMLMQKYASLCQIMNKVLLLNLNIPITSTIYTMYVQRTHLTCAFVSPPNHISRNISNCDIFTENIFTLILPKVGVEG